MKTKITAILLSLCLSAAVLPVAAVDGEDAGQEAVRPTGSDYASYLSALEERYGDGLRPAAAEPVTVPAAKARTRGALPLKKGVGGKEEPVIVWTDSSEGERLEWAEWDLPAADSGLYEIVVEYYIPEEQSAHAVRGFEIDGKTLFDEASSVYFHQMFADKHAPDTNVWGDEISPSQKTVPAWRKQALCDSLGLYSQPFRIYLEKGTHVFRLTLMNQSMFVAGVTLRPAENPPAYAELRQTYEGFKPASRAFSAEAERTILWKNTPVIRPDNDRNPTCTPRDDDRIVMNVLDGLLWRKGNESVTWKLTVPETGLYKISMRVKQAWGDGLPSFRRIEIDGEVPFRELLNYSFPYRRDWQTVTLAGDDGEPFLFYLEEGVHTLTMTAKTGAMTPVIRAVGECVDITSAMILNIKMITGDSPDLNYEYRLENKIPGLMQDIAYVYGVTSELANRIEELSEKRPPAANAFAQVAADFKIVADDPDLLTRKLPDLENALETLGAWYTELQVQPLGMDSFYFAPPTEKVPDAKTSFWDVAWITLKSFIRSFYRDYNRVDATGDETAAAVLDIWVGRGKEWSRVLKEAAEDGFTRETGIRLNISTIPAGQLATGAVNSVLLAVAAGREPDAALGVAYNLPVEFALRGVPEPLSDYPGVSEMTKRFVPGILTPFMHEGRLYAVPETMNFKTLIYRKDLLAKLGLTIPDTWQDVYDHILPSLYQNNLNFYVPAGDISPFLFQLGGDFYTEDGSRSALDTKEAFDAFSEWTDLFTYRGVPVSANFYNRFRSGLIPMGIGGYTEYVSLLAAAPELKGKIGLAPLPGHKRADGTVDRSCGGYADTAAVVFKSCSDKEAAVRFLEWWTSTDVQTEYGKNLEAVVGIESRWNSANTQAFLAMSWSDEEKSVIRESFRWVKEMPVVLGGYYTSRHLINAWNRTVIGKTDARDSLEQAVLDINRELRMRREEAGRLEQP